MNADNNYEFVVRLRGKLGTQPAQMISCSAVEITSTTSKPGKEKGSECNEKLLMKTYVLSAFLYEPEGQRLSTGSAGEPKYSTLKYGQIGESLELVDFGKLIG